METRVSDQAAFVLHRREWQNSSYILELLTLEYGRMGIIAKGARKARNRALYQPFTLLSLGWSGRQELKTLTTIEGQVIPVDEHHYLTLMYVNDLLMQLLPRQEPAKEIFAAYLELLKAASVELSEADLREFELLLLRTLGYFGDISQDNHGQPVDRQGSYLFEAGSGFAPCMPTQRHAISGQDLLDWEQKKYDLDEVILVARTVMRQSIDASLEGRPLKSRQVYQQMKRQ